MAVFRVERNTGYTVMSNHHLRNKELTLKAKGLLSQMLSLPEDWDYTLAGLSHINREKIDAIREAVKELEKAGYIVRSRERDEKGRLRGADYVIYEQPQPKEPEAATSSEQPPTSDLPTLENPTLDNPTLEKPTLEKPTLENPTQLNKDISSKEQSITDLSSTHSIPFHSLNPLPYEQDEAATPPERKRTEAKTNSAIEIYREIIKDNIDYDILIQDPKMDKDRLDEIVEIMLETVCTARKTIRIAGDDYPAELVKSKFMKLNSSHVEFVLDCMRENTTKMCTVGVLPLSSICWTSVNISVIPSISRPESISRTRKAIMCRRTNGRFSRILMKPLSAKRLSTLHRKSEARSDDTPMDGAKLLLSQACSTVPIAAARCMSTALTTASVSLNTLAHSTQKSLVERSARHSTVSMKMWYCLLSPICSEP